MIEWKASKLFKKSLLGLKFRKNISFCYYPLSLTYHFGAFVASLRWLITPVHNPPLALKKPYIIKCTQSQTTLPNNQSSLHSKLDEVIYRLTTLESNQTTFDSDIGHSGHSTSPPWPNHAHMKLEVPRFDGSNSMNRISRISLFFLL